MKLRLAAALFLMIMPALTGPAAADTRENVMLRLPRCSPITDTHQYLDCYYAAVQPMRAELGLAPAPQDGAYAPLFSLGQAPAAGAPLTPQSAGIREDVMVRLTRCSAIGDTRQYMDCYYAAAQPLRAELGLVPAPQASTYAPLFSLSQVMPAQQPRLPDAPLPDRPNLVPQSAYATASTPRPAPVRRVEGDAGATHLGIIGGLVGISTTRVAPDQFGLKNALPTPGGVDHIAAHIVHVEIDRYSGDFTVTLDNGQVWRQVVNDDTRAHWRKDITGSVATVAYGAGSSFNLTIGEDDVYKVRRVS